MPIEIRELIIRMTIEEKPATNPDVVKEIRDIRAEVVRECIEKIMSKLENSQER